MCWCPEACLTVEQACCNASNFLWLGKYFLSNQPSSSKEHSIGSGIAVRLIYICYMSVSLSLYIYWAIYTCTYAYIPQAPPQCHDPHPGRRRRLPLARPLCGQTGPYVPGPRPAPGLSVGGPALMARAAYHSEHHSEQKHQKRIWIVVA